MLRRRAVQQRGCLVCSFYCSGTTLFICCLFGFNYSKDMLLYLFLSLSHFIGLIAGDTISPEGDEVSGTEGQSVKLKCNYQKTASYAALHWYKHHSDLQAPQFILWKQGKGGTARYIPDPRYESQTSDSTTELTIKTLTLADTALYYCALRVGCYYLTFGDPIRLNVVPSGPPVEPNLFVLSPLLPEDWMGEVVDLPPEACLATDFRSNKSEMILNVKNESLTLETTNAIVSQERSSYVYVGFTDRTIFSCEMQKSFSNNENIDRCADIYPEKAKLKFFLLLLNGVRMVFTKAVAFNTILTIRTLLF